MDEKNCCPTTAGGNSTVTNGDEQEPLKRVVEISTRTEGAQDSEMH